MTSCPGCYKPLQEGYCRSCLRALFDGKKVSPVLPFDPPGAENLSAYQERSSRLSISGVQLKYSLRLVGKQLQLVEADGHYILKPIPLTSYIVNPNYAPANEHLTMQLAAQAFRIKTAANALVFFKDGTPAYLTRRFDVKPDGTRHLQEDMAQISGRTNQTAGEHYKYDGTYEEIGQLIRRYVAAYPLALESYFSVVLFNYLFSNGDAHMKNFSLIQTDMGDHTLTPAYDLMATVLHTPNESDTALDLYDGDLQSDFYSKYGFYGQSDFKLLAEKIGLLPIRTAPIFTHFLAQQEKVLSLIEQSILPADMQEKYCAAFTDKFRRLTLTA